MDKLRVKKLFEAARLPERALSSNGYDLFAYGDYILSPGETKIISAGIAIELEIGYAAVMFDRSSLGARGITGFHELACIPLELEVVPFAGVIDGDYRGQIGVVLHNFGKEQYQIKHLQKIAQFLIIKTAMPTVVEVAELEETQRGEGGFGSTDKGLRLTEVIKKHDAIRKKDSPLGE